MNGFAKGNVGTLPITKTSEAFLATSTRFINHRKSSSQRVSAFQSMQRVYGVVHNPRTFF